MSDTNSFIDEVTEAVRRDRLYGYLRKYGWIPALVIVAIVAGTGWNEYRKAQVRAGAQAVGDALIAALEPGEAAARAAALATVRSTTPGNDAVRQMLLSTAQGNSDRTDAAVEGLNRLALNGDLPQSYRDIAAFKALLMQAEALPAAERQAQFEALAEPGKVLRLLAEEQLALIEVELGETDAAMARLQAILQDAEVTLPLQDRASRLIVALGGKPEPLTPVTLGQVTPG